MADDEQTPPREVSPGTRRKSDKRQRTETLFARVTPEEKSAFVARADRAGMASAAFMRAAARIKPERGHVRDEPRKAQVIANAGAEAERLAGSPALRRYVQGRDLKSGAAPRRVIDLFATQPKHKLVP